MKRVRLFISGDVLGVGYRAWMKRQAKALGVAGWVKNREDKIVEIIAEGNEQELKQLINMCKRGPDISWVERVDTRWERATGEFIGFEVLY
jgi:acylphosphatase